MQKKRLWAVVGTVFAVLLIALLVIPSFIDWSKYQSIARDKVRSSTGYDLTIGGKLRMSLLPTPHATVTQVVVTKPVKDKPDPFLTLEKADVRLALLPLLVGRIEVASITLEKPVVNLITYKTGVDNYTPAKPEQNPEQAGTTSEPAGPDDEVISVNQIHIRDGLVTMRNDAEGTTRVIGIEDLNVKADTLTGPFDGDGKISYGDADFKLDMTTGGYKKGESLPVQFNLEEADGRAAVKWSGVVVPGNKDYQGELNATFSDLQGVLDDAGIAFAVPDMGKVGLSGMLTVNPNAITLTNGTLQIGKTKFKSRLSVTEYGKPAMNVSADFDTDDYLDLNGLMKAGEEVADKQKKEAKKEEKAAPKKDEKTKDASTKVKPLLPEGFKLPADFSASVQLAARGIDYRGERTGQMGLRFNALKGEGTGDLTISDLPGGGNISASTAITQEDGVTGSVLANISSLKKVFAEWLELVDEDVLEEPGMPKRIDLQANYKVAGYNATAKIDTLSLGETKLSGTLGYTAASRPVVTAVLKGNVFTLPSSKKETDKKEETPAQKEGDKAADAQKPAEISFNFDPPQLPFDLKFDIALDRLVKDELVMQNVVAAGTYNGTMLSLTKGQAMISGGTIGATGTVADLKALSGIDVNASLRTDDLETFVAAMTGKPMELKQKIGQFAGSLKAKGDRKKMAADVTAAARGYTISASGTLDDPFSPDLPGTMNVRIRHGNLTEAIRVFSPAFNNSGTPGAPKPVDLSGTARINGKVYEFSDMKGTLGASDVAGSVKADLSGKVPSITASLNSTKMDLGSILGVDNKTAKVSSSSGASAANTPPPAAAGNWSREQLDLDLMKSMNLDIDIDAKTLIYGTWTLTDAKAGIDLKDGVLKVSPLSGGLYGGTFDGGLNANIAGGAAPTLNVEGKADVKDVSVGPFLQALMSSGTKRADGKGSLNLNVKTTGSSAGQIMNGLNGETSVTAKDLVIYGMDIDKLAANIVEAFDGGWKGVLAGVTTQGLASGNTSFKNFSQKFPIQSGDMKIQNFRMETASANAILNTNGTVSFGRYAMDVQTDVMVTQPKDVPVVNLRISGPLNAPTKSVNSTALDNLIRAKVGDKVQDLVKDKLGDSPLGNALGQFLGGTQKPAAAPTVTPTAPAATPPAATQPSAPVTPEAAPVAPAAPSAEPQAVVPQAAPAEPAAPAPQEQKSPEQQLLEGVLNRLAE